MYHFCDLFFQIRTYSNFKYIFSYIVIYYVVLTTPQRLLMVITEGYILLGDSAFLSLHSSTLQQILHIVIGQVSPRGVPYVFLVLEAILRKFPVEGGLLVVNAGIISTILKSCAANWFNAEDCEPDRVIILYLTAISRILLSSPHVLDNCFPIPYDLGTNLMFTTKELVSTDINFYSICSFHFRELFNYSDMHHYLLSNSLFLFICQNAWQTNQVMSRGTH